MKMINNKIGAVLAVLTILLFVGTINVAYAKEYTYNRIIEIPTENIKDTEIASLLESVSTSTIDIKTDVAFTKSLDNLGYYLAKGKVGSENNLRFEIVMKNQDREDQTGLELKIFVLNPLDITRGEVTFDLSEFKKENNLVSGDTIKLPYVYYQIPSNAVEGKWAVYSTIYKRDVDSKVQIPISMSTEPQASFEVDYGWGKWMPIVLFLLVSIMGSAFGSAIIDDDQKRVLIFLATGILAFIFT